MKQKTNIILSVTGLGYVGLPLALEFAKKFKVIGFDINEARVALMKKGIDPSQELSSAAFDNANITFTSVVEPLAEANFHIIGVPTDIDKNKVPNLKPLISASKSIGKILKKGDTVVYESTVYPGCTEEDCIPVLEKYSGLIAGVDFQFGYSPERINPGDKEHTVKKILKVTSGSTPAIADEVDALYKSIIVAGTHKAPSIKVAEAAKVIENSQRDINIAFVNEVAKIFNLMGIDTHDVLEAAGTKWNFLKFKPGLVGGHCIGVDPYYLAQKAEELGYHPEILFAGRRLNDGMGKYVAGEVVKLMVKKDIKVKGSKALILGFTFKEDCPDVRNTKVIDIVRELETYGVEVIIHDPWADEHEVQHEYGVVSSKTIPSGEYQSVVLAVAHKEFKSLNIKNLVESGGVIYDVKGLLEEVGLGYTMKLFVVSKVSTFKN